MYLTDLTFIRDGNPDYRISTQPNQEGKPCQLVNFDKYLKISKIIEEVKRFQLPYALVEIEDIQEFLKSQINACQNHGDPKELYQKSLELEPKESNSGSIEMESILGNAGLL